MVSLCREIHFFLQFFVKLRDFDLPGFEIKKRCKQCEGFFIYSEYIVIA